MMTMALVMPAQGYHIDGSEVPTPPGEAGSWTSADWFNAGAALIVCEDNVPGDPAAGSTGTGGLCFTGENDATGVNASTSRPAPGDWVGLRTCDVLTFDRNNGFGPYPPTGPAGCASSSGPGLTAAVTYTAQLGVYTCDVAEGQALYYDRLYSWWSYDDNDDSGPDGIPPYDPGEGEGAVSAGANNETTAQGHVAVFMDPGGVHASGSIETALFTAVAGGLGAAGGNYVPCGSSPVGTGNGGTSVETGPVVVGDSW